MRSMYLIRSSFGRATSVSVCMLLLVSQAAAAISSTFDALGPLLTHLKKQQQQVGAQIPPFTDQPTAVYYGDNPSRDETHRGGLWTDDDLSVLQQQIQDNNAQRGDADAGTTGKLRYNPSQGTTVTNW